MCNFQVTKVFLSVPQNVITPSGERRVGKDIAVRVYCRVKSPGMTVVLNMGYHLMFR
jgi:hypothetical protein